MSNGALNTIPSDPIAPWVIALQRLRSLLKQLPNFNHLDYHYEWYNLLGLTHFSCFILVGGGCHPKSIHFIVILGCGMRLIGKTLLNVGAPEQAARKLRKSQLIGGRSIPRNCFMGGQETNCRINHLIFKITQKGKGLSLWFCPTPNYKDIESNLLTSFHTPWNK